MNELTNVRFDRFTSEILGKSPIRSEAGPEKNSKTNCLPLTFVSRVAATFWADDGDGCVDADDAYTVCKLYREFTSF